MSDNIQNRVIRVAKRNHKTPADCLRYNHNDIFYFPHFSLRKHIDRVTYTCKYQRSVSLISEILKDAGFRRVSKNKLDKGNYIFVDTYRNSDDISTVLVFYDLVPEKYRLPPLTFTVHDPNKELIDRIASSFAKQEMQLSVSDIELAFDFYTSSTRERRELYKFMKKHVFFKSSQSNPDEDSYWNTFYLNQKKESNKGEIVYLRDDFNGKKIVRLELLLKRKILKNSALDPS